MSGLQQRIGKVGQEYAAVALRSLGVEMVEKIGTPVILIKTKTPGVFRVIFEETVSGDHHGILPGGRYVLAETKTVFDRNLVWSDFRDHQPTALTKHAELGGVALVVWVNSSGSHVMRWPIPGFGPGKGITPEQARRMEVTRSDIERWRCYERST